ncbi:MAG: hypothetical protein QXP97_01465 [Desulfurococcus sp.]
MSEREKATEDVKVRPSTKRKLDALKSHPRETYDQVITRLIEFYEKHKQ